MLKSQRIKKTRDIRRSHRTHAKIKARATGLLPRLSIFRSNRGIYAQIIDDAAAKTLVAASTLELKEQGKGMNKTAQAEAVGTLIAEKAKKQKIEKIVFDRGSYRYHGRVKAVADAARSAGLKF